jgi:hypothetical protein
MRMHRLIVVLAVAAALAVPSGGLVLADNFHDAGIPGVGASGQPDPGHNGIGCGNAGSTVTPGNAANSPGSGPNPNNNGSPFNPNNTKDYAGNPGNPNPSDTGNTHPVSQYDVACFQQTQHAP